MNGVNALMTLRLAGLAGMLGVLIGAFGGHLLSGYLELQNPDPVAMAKQADRFEIGVRYHLVHAVALLAVAALQLGQPGTSSRLLPVVAWLMVAGILLFSGSLYVMVLSGKTWLGMITPIGGLSWIVAWSLLLFSRHAEKKFS